MREDTAMDRVAREGHQTRGAPTNLPRHLTTFVGREAELRSLKPLVRGSRMLSLVGTGGAGKTRLAAEVARANRDEWPDGIWWVELAAESGVGGAVVAILELPGSGSPRDVVASWLASRRVLLILDNCEHVIDECARLCQFLLERCPALTILATSREPLGVPGEVRWPVSSLGDPDAVNLFEARARLVASDFKVAPPNREPVVAICNRLDRLPLAIEMAAARLDLMSERELLANLNDSFELLASGARTVPERQQTMAAAIDWSHRLLTRDEAQLFRRLAVFQGGFTLEAVRAVCSESGSRDVIDVLRRLVQKSMVVADRLDDGSTRYRLLESHRDYAEKKLIESSDLETMQRRHYDYFRGQRWKPRESANFWAAVSWARGNGDDNGLVLALEIADSDFGDQTRARNLLLDLLETTLGTDFLRAKALSLAARLSWRLGDVLKSRSLADSSVSVARGVGDAELMAQVLIAAGLVHQTAGELATAGRMYDEAQSLLDSSSNRQLAADVGNHRGLLAIERGDVDGALTILRDCVSLAEAQRDVRAAARYRESLANAELGSGDIHAATASWSRSLATFRDLNDWFGTIWCMGGLALAAAARREDQRAIRLAAAVDRMSHEYSLTTWSFRAKQLDDAVDQARNRIGVRKADDSWQQGQTMSSVRALEYALSGDGPVEDTAAQAGPLSRREREVAEMVATGMTNKQIAERLFISERTAEGHVERIRNKLGMRSRTEVAAWAVAHGLGRGPLDKPSPSSKV